MDNVVVENVISILQSGKSLPPSYQEILFPVNNKEYTLQYKDKKTKEKILSVGDEPQAVPFQIEKEFNCSGEEWKNLLICGDNYQALKTIYENKDELIKDKVKGKVNLIYIDPPFATESDFSAKDGEKAYSDKIKGAEFIEFLRERLVLAREILSDDGSIFVHLDMKKYHYIKIVMDEIFGENNFRNEIVWQSSSSGKTVTKNLSKDTQFICWYSKSDKYKFRNVYTQLSDKTLKMYKYDDNDGRGKYRLYPLQKTDGPTVGTKYTYIDETGKEWKAPKKGWRMIEPKLKALELDNRLWMKGKTLQEKAYWNERDNTGKLANNLWIDCPNLQGNNKEICGYPTQKPLSLLQRIIQMATDENDIVMDFFAGSGTTLVAAEKMKRKWIGCDLGKLSIYTIQKRLLTLENQMSSFCLVNAGCYNLNTVFELGKEKYYDFVLDLFHVDRKNSSINGIPVDGKRRGDWVKVFTFQDFEDNTAIDINYLNDLHIQIGSKIGKRFYLIAPEMNVDIIGDYYKIDDVKYYLLRIPYQVIAELHKIEFKKLQQPNNKDKVNSIENSVGFYFNEMPEVKTRLKVSSKKIDINIESVISPYIKLDKNNKVIENILAMVLIDTSDNSNFIMQNVFFADDIKTNKGYLVSIEKSKVQSKQIKVIYIDIFGNEFKEILEV